MKSATVRIDELALALATVTKERDSAKRSWGELAVKFEDMRSGRDAMALDFRAQLAAVTKERDEALHELKEHGAWCWQVPDGLARERDSLQAENDRLRAAIAPTAENVEAVAYTFGLARGIGTHLSAEELAEDVLTAIAARVGRL
jgi:hypothetical protein